MNKPRRWSLNEGRDDEEVEEAKRRGDTRSALVGLDLPGGPFHASPSEWQLNRLVDVEYGVALGCTAASAGKAGKMETVIGRSKWCWPFPIGPKG